MEGSGADDTLGGMSPTLSGTVLKTGGPNFPPGRSRFQRNANGFFTATVPGRRFSGSVRFDRAPETLD